MAVKPSNAALAALRNTRRAKQEELGRAYEAMGGSNTALVSNSQFAPNTIPSLKRNIENRYAEAQNAAGNALDRDSQAYANLQSMTPAYNDYKIRETEEILNRLGQTDIARGSNSLSVERAKEGHLQSGLVNSLSENEKLGRILTSLTGSSAPYQAYKQMENEAMKGTLTDEMKALGLTREDIDRWNRQQNEIERREVATNYATQHPFLATVNSFPEMAAGSAEGVLDKIANYVQGKPLESSPINAELYRNAVSQDMSGLGNFAYGVGTSMGDMLTANLFGGVAGPGLMGLEKANSVMNEAIDRGLTPNQIVGEGLASGASTAITEKLLGPFGKFAGNNALKAALGEGLQEGAEDIVDTLFDELITRAGGNNEKSVWNQNLQMYRDAGYSEEDAKKAVVVDYLKQLGIDIGAGAISGGIFQGGNNILNQRNIINGRSRVNTETENNVEADVNNAEAEIQNELPVLRNSIEEEAKATTLLEQQRANELEQLKEAYAEIQRQNEQNIPAVEQTQNYDPEEMEYLRNVLLETSRESQNWELPVDESRSAEEVITELKDRVINELQTNEPLAGEHVGDLVNRLKYVAQNNPELQPFISEQLNELMRESEGWVTDFGNQQIPQVRNVAEMQTAENDARQMVNSFIQDLESGNVSNPMNTYASVLADLTETAQNYPEIRENLNGMLREVNAAMPNAQQTETNTQPTKQTAETYSDEDIRNLSNIEDATTALNEEVSALKNEIGSHPLNIEFFSRNERGEVESEDSDRVQTGRYKTSKTYTNTAERSGNLTDEQRRMVEQNGSMLYQENSWKESTEEAEKRIIEGGWQGEFEKLTAKDANTFNNVDVDEMFMLWRHYKEQAVALDKKGLDSTSTWQKTVDCLTQLKAAGSHAGSELNAFKKWSMNNTPEGLLTEAEVIIDEYINGLNEGAKKLAKKNPWLAQIARETKGKTRQMDVAFIKQFLTEAEKLAPTHTVKKGETLADIAKAYNTTADALIELNGKDIKPGDTITVNRLDPDSQEARVIMANLGKMVNTQIPVSLREKITTLLMDNMLGNFRTLITRNFGGNVGYNLIEQNITKNIAAKIDKALSEKRGTARTISENTKEGRQAYKEGFKEAFKQEWFDLTNNLRTARSGENNLRTAVANNRQIFSDKNIFGKVGNMYDRLVRSGLSVGDRPFYEGVYRQYMTEYRKMFDQGLLKDMSEEEFNKTAEALAQIKALEAVYQDDSEMAQAFMAAKNMVSLASKAVTGVDIMSQFTMPFVKTPANIAQRAIEYSPVGFIKNAVKTIRELRHTMTANGQMDFDQQRFATDTARNLVGSVMWGIALYMASAGILTGAYDDDEDMRAAQKEAGMQEYALHLPINGGMDIDVSSMPVIGNDLVAAAASYDAFKNNPELSVLQRIGKGFSAGIEKQFESSALQGLQRLFGANSSYGYGGQGSNGSIMDQAKDTIKAGASQLIPSLLRQFSTAADPYQRRLTGLNADDYYINNLRSAIPWLRQDLQPKIGRTGEVLEQNHSQTVAGRWFNNFINPFNVTYGTEDAVRDEAMRLYESTGNNVAFQPYVSMKELMTDDHIPTDEEFTQYQQNAYGAMNQIARDVINSDYYQGLTDGDKESLLASIYKAVKTVEKANILGSDKSDLSGAEKAYDLGGEQGLIDYVTAQTALASLNITNNEGNRDAILQTLNSNGGDLSAIASDYQQSTSRASTEIDSLMNGQYSDLISLLGAYDSEGQINLRNNINSAINGVEFNSTVGNSKDYEGAQQAYNNGGVNALAEYLIPGAILNNAGMTNNANNREMILNAYNEGGASAVQQIIQASQILGNDSNLTYKYNHATNYIPSLTPVQFQNTWNAINTDGNTSIKIDELIDYLNQNPGNYNEQTALQYWNAFYTGTSEKIPVLVNGHWEAKKP